ncbi:PREDICTED: uncharacterized protein LOC107345686 [Acropora digitifera]|uniref:uncharacterized protein LOC107345686 n=1 Tax=Acropora digitifera TaxID=70779 RepID=UPI00077AA6C3|nr:PREDICTED: uncharacterized protein LOC107345686 [Acropora digitifera]
MAMSIVEGSTSESGSEYSSETEDFQVEFEATSCGVDESASTGTETQNYMEPYAEEPLADEEWLQNYRNEQEEKEDLEEELKLRLDNFVPVSDWCSCLQCCRDLLRNINECYCCKELEGCVEAITCDLVREDLGEGEELKCVTEHPGFRPVCLEKWSLRMASSKYRKRDKQTYKKTGSEERYLRAVAYREFSRLVYGYLGKRRVPLPACAYTAIRETFPTEEDDLSAGFQLGEFD